MTKATPTTPPRRPTVTGEDLRRILGELEAAKLIEILELEPELTDIEEAAMCMAGDQDVLAKSGHHVSGTAGRIVEILSAGEEDEAPTRQ